MLESIQGSNLTILVRQKLRSKKNVTFGMTGADLKEAWQTSLIQIGLMEPTGNVRDAINSDKNF